MPLRPGTTIAALTATAGLLCGLLWVLESGADSGPASSRPCSRIDDRFITPGAEHGDRVADCRGRVADRGETRLLLIEVRDESRQDLRHPRPTGPREVVDFTDPSAPIPREPS